MAVLRLARFRYVVLSVLLLLLFFVVRNPTQTDEKLYEEQELELACRHPDLDLLNPDIQKHVKDLGELSCDREEDWLEIQKGMLVTNEVIVKRHGKIRCKISYIKRKSDFSTELGKAMEFTSDENMFPIEDDFFVVKCTAKDGTVWKNLMAGVYRNDTVLKKVQMKKLPRDATKLNVMIFGLDSVSRLHFMRKLPKTYTYLTDVLKAAILKGYNIVGDGTPQALIPILTGYTERELPETRKRIATAQYVDIYPFAWKNYSQSGYITTYGEDYSPWVGTFQYRLKGFNEAPADHYLRTFYLELYKRISDHPKWCLGNKPRHVMMLEYLKHFFDAYFDIPKFAFVFHAELSHDDYNLVGYADSDTEQFLKDLQDSGTLNNTMLIIFSDHGNRFSTIRQTQQGKQEERMPFFSIVMPPWFEKKYPTFMRNLRINENRLVTPFDIHATLLTLLNPKIPERGDSASRSISLFSEIPQERTCTMASIEPHWCACLSWVKMSAKEQVAVEVSEAVINHINGITLFQREVCEVLRLKTVLRIERLQPNKALLKYKKNADKDGFVGEFSDDTKVTERFYQVQFQVSPSDGIYEASVKQSANQNIFIVKEEEISRVNMYGNQEHCIHDAYPDIRKYCYCKVQL